MSDFETCEHITVDSLASFDDTFVSVTSVEDSLDQNEIDCVQKTVRFSDEIEFISIPRFNLNLYRDLFWDSIDRHRATEECHKEVKKVAKSQRLSFKEARTVLYQPHELDVLQATSHEPSKILCKIKKIIYRMGKLVHR